MMIVGCWVGGCSLAGSDTAGTLQYGSVLPCASGASAFEAYLIVNLQIVHVVN